MFRETVSLVIAKSWGFTVQHTKFTLYNGPGARLRYVSDKLSYKI